MCAAGTGTWIVVGAGCSSSQSSRMMCRRCGARNRAVRDGKTAESHGRRTARAIALSHKLLELGVYVVGFFFPVVPRGQARIRVQMSAAHDRAQLETAVAAFKQAGRELGLVQ